MSRPSELPPGVEAAIATATRAAWQAGFRYKGASTSSAIAAAVEYAVSMAALAWATGAAQAEAARQADGGSP